MINGAIAGLLFFLYCLAGFKITSLIPPRENESEFSNSRADIAGFAWIVGGLAYFFAFIYMMDTCSSLGAMMVAWALILAGFGALAIVATIVIFILAEGIPFLWRKTKPAIQNTWAAEQVELAIELAENNPKQAKTLRNILIALALVGAGAFAGTLPNPKCEAPSVVQTPPDVEAIRQVLSENAPELMDDLDRLVD